MSLTSPPPRFANSTPSRSPQTSPYLWNETLREGRRIATSDRTLATITQQAGRLKEVRKEELDYGDWVVVTTRNSTYSIRVLEGDRYSISGGWFDNEGLSPLRTTITGCTWGGSAIKLDIVAACGLHLEFGNRVVTSAIQKVCVMRFGGENINN